MGALTALLREGKHVTREQLADALDYAEIEASRDRIAYRDLDERYHRALNVIDLAAGYVHADHRGDPDRCVVGECVEIRKRRNEVTR